MNIEDITQSDIDRANKANSYDLFQQEIADLRIARRIISNEIVDSVNKFTQDMLIKAMRELAETKELLAAAIKPPPAKPSDV